MAGEKLPQRASLRPLEYFIKKEAMGLVMLMLPASVVLEFGADKPQTWNKLPPKWTVNQKLAVKRQRQWRGPDNSMLQSRSRLRRRGSNQYNVRVRRQHFATPVRCLMPSPDMRIVSPENIE